MAGVDVGPRRVGGGRVLDTAAYGDPGPLALRLLRERGCAVVTSEVMRQARRDRVPRA